MLSVCTRTLAGAAGQRLCAAPPSRPGKMLCVCACVRACVRVRAGFMCGGRAETQSERRRKRQKAAVAFGRAACTVAQQPGALHRGTANRTGRTSGRGGPEAILLLLLLLLFPPVLLRPEAIGVVDSVLFTVAPRRSGASVVGVRSPPAGAGRPVPLRVPSCLNRQGAAPRARSASCVA